MLARCTHVGFFKHVALTIMVDKHPLSDVELSLLEKKRSFNVLLDYELKALKLLLSFVFLSLLFVSFLNLNVRDALAHSVQFHPVVIPQD